MFFEHLGEALGVFGEVFQRHCAILNEGHRLAVTLHRHHDVEPRLAHLPYVALQGGINDFDHAAGEAEVAHQLNQLFQLAMLFVLVVARKLHQQDRIRIALNKLFDDGPERRITACQSDHGAVHQLYGHRLQFNDVLRRFHRLEKRREVAHAQCFVFGQR